MALEPPSSKISFQAITQVVHQALYPGVPVAHHLAHRHPFHQELGDIHGQQEALPAVCPFAEQRHGGFAGVLVKLDRGGLEDTLEFRIRAPGDTQLVVGHEQVTAQVIPVGVEPARRYFLPFRLLGIDFTRDVKSSISLP